MLYHELANTNPYYCIITRSIHRDQTDSFSEEVS